MIKTKGLFRLFNFTAFIVLSCTLVSCGDSSELKEAQQKIAKLQAKKLKGFKQIELDDFIAEEKQRVEKSAKGGKLITMAAPVYFTAKMKRLPEEKTMNYIYTALQMAEMSPMPKVKHQMFVESPKGEVISVYVEESAVARLNKFMQAEQSAQFLGYHAYSYKRGPAILITEFIPVIK